jgi:KDEL-tailed cysteine endopeptidase
VLSIFLLTPFSLFILVTVCDEAGNTTCTETNNVCLNDNGNQTCGNCANGYISLPDDDTCILIEDLPWETYFEKFQPVFTSDIDLTERLVKLYIVLKYISNKMSTIPPPTFDLGINAFCADTAEERLQLLGFRSAAEGQANEFPAWEPPSRLRGLADLPEKKDWVEEGALTPIKNQGRCGSCWSFTITSAVEAAVFIDKGFSQDLSVQQLVSCDDDNYGCNGGNLMVALRYAWKNNIGGLTSEAEYPYTDSEGTTTETCSLGDKQLNVAIANPQVVVDYDQNLNFDERISRMKAALADQPIPIAVNAACNTFNYYKRGIVTNDEDCFCEDVSCINHAVLLVAYDDTSSPPSWTIRNSWGSGYGENGYILVSQLGGGEWGLFGLLGSGTIIGRAVNTTEPLPSSAMSLSTTVGLVSAFAFTLLGLF